MPLILCAKETGDGMIISITTPVPLYDNLWRLTEAWMQKRRKECVSPVFSNEHSLQIFTLLLGGGKGRNPYLFIPEMSECDP
jgi:hypothetical protein